MSLDDAARLVQTERESNPKVVDLARLLSISARAEPELVRAMRLAIFPDSEAGLETDVWFSSLVQARNATGLTLLPDVVRFFRNELTSPVYRVSLHRAREIVRTVHSGISPALALEEDVTYLATLNTPEATAEMENLLGRVLKALAPGDRALASWVARTLPRMPEAVRHSDAAMALAIEASRQLGGLSVSGVPTVEGATSWHPSLIAGLARESIGLRLLEDCLEITHPPIEGAEQIGVPSTRPILLEISSPTDEGWTTRKESIEWQSTRRIPLEAGPMVTVRTLSGDQHRLRAAIGLDGPTLLLIPRGYDRQPSIWSRVQSDAYMAVNELGWGVTSSESPTGAAADAIWVSLSSDRYESESGDISAIAGRLKPGGRLLVGTQRAIVRVPTHDNSGWQMAIAELRTRAGNIVSSRTLRGELGPHLLAIDREAAQRYIARSSAEHHQAIVSPIEGPELIGREDVVAELTRLFAESTSGNYWLVTGEAGIGKSAVLRGFARAQRAAGHLVLYRDLTDAGGRQLDDEFGKIVGELGLLLGTKTIGSSLLSERFEGLLDSFGRRTTEPPDSMFMIVDGLDRHDDAQNPPDLLLRYLPVPLPRHMFVLTSVRGTMHTTFVFKLDDTRWRASADAAIRRSWADSPAASRAANARIEQVSGGDVLERVLKFSEGNYRVSRMLNAWVARSSSGGRIPEEFRGLSGVVHLVRVDLDREVQRQPDVPERDAVRALFLQVLGWLVVAQDPLPVLDLVATPSSDKPAPVPDFVGVLAPLLEAQDPSVDRLRLVDRSSVGSAILDAFPEIDLRSAHAGLIDAIQRMLDRSTHASPSVQWAGGYLGRYDLHHLEASERFSALAERLSSIERVSELLAFGYDEAVGQFSRILGRISSSGSPPGLGERLTTILEVLRDEAHWLRRDPGALQGLVFNALRRKGVASDRIEHDYGLRPLMRLVRMVNPPDHWPPRPELGFRGHRSGIIACAPLSEVEHQSKSQTRLEGAQIVSAERSDTLRWWQMWSGADSRRFTSELWKGLTSLALSRERGLVLCGDRSGGLFVLESGKRSSISELGRHRDAVSACDIPAEGDWILSATRGGDVRKSRIPAKSADVVERNVGSAVIDCALTPGGAFVVTRDAVHLLNSSSLEELTVATSAPILTDYIDRDEEAVLVVCAGEPPFWLRLNSDLQLEKSSSGFTEPVTATRGEPRACVAAEAWIAIATGDGIQVASGSSIRLFRGHRDVVTALTKVHFDEREVLVSASEDYTLRIWNVEDGLPIRTLGRYGPGQQLLDVAATSQLCAFASDGERINFVALGRESESETKLVDEGITALAFADNDQHLIVGLASGHVLPLSSRTREGSPIAGDGHEVPVTAIAWDPVSRTLATGGEDGSIVVWSLEGGGREVGRVHQHRAAIQRIVAHRDVWISASEDGLVCEWHKTPFTGRRRVEFHEGPVRWLDVSADGTVAATAGADGTCCTWGLELPFGEPRVINAGSRGVSACAISPDGRHVALGADDGRITVWELSTERHITTFEGHTRSVTGLTFIVNDQLLSWSLDRTLRQWDLGTSSAVAVTYGEAPFVSVKLPPRPDSWPGPICALDAAGLLWIVDFILPT